MHVLRLIMLVFFLFKQHLRWLIKNNVTYWLLQIHTMSLWQKLKSLIQLLACSLACILCLLVTCLTIFWASKLYASFLSEYFIKKVEEKKEIQKQEEKEQQEAEATLALTLHTPSATALPGKKKATKPGFGLLDFNIFCNTELVKVLKYFLKYSMGTEYFRTYDTASHVYRVWLLCLKSSFWSQQFLVQKWERGKYRVFSSFTCIGWTEFLPLFYSSLRQEVITLQSEE